MRRKLDDTRRSITHRVCIGGTLTLYITVGLYDDGKPGELFIQIDQEESGMAGMVKCWALSISLLLQNDEYGMIIRKFRNQQFDPRGFTDNEKIRNCSSIPDYVANWLDQNFGHLYE